MLLQVGEMPFIPSGMRDDVWSAPPDTITQNTTFVFDDRARPSKIRAMDTFAKYFANRDNVMCTAPRCVSADWSDDPCNLTRWTPLCVFSSKLLCPE